VIIDGDIGSEMYFILEGRIEILVRVEDGVQKRAVCMGTGQYFGELALLEAEHVRSTTVRTISFCEFRTLNRKNFLVITARYPEFGIHFLELVEARMVKHEEHELKGKKRREAKELKKIKKKNVGKPESENDTAKREQGQEPAGRRTSTGRLPFGHTSPDLSINATPASSMDNSQRVLNEGLETAERLKRESEEVLQMIFAAVKDVCDSDMNLQKRLTSLAGKVSELKRQQVIVQSSLVKAAK